MKVQWLRGKDWSIGVHGQISNIVEDAPYRKSKKDEDNYNKWEKEQELKDHWMAGSGLMLCDTPDPAPMCDVGRGCHCSFYLYTITYSFMHK